MEDKNNLKKDDHNIAVEKTQALETITVTKKTENKAKVPTFSQIKGFINNVLNLVRGLFAKKNELTLTTLQLHKDGVRKRAEIMSIDFRNQIVVWKDKKSRVYCDRFPEEVVLYFKNIS